MIKKNNCTLAITDFKLFIYFLGIFVMSIFFMDLKKFSVGVKITVC